MKAIDKHLTKGWERFYVKRWLETGIQYSDGARTKQMTGTPQGGVVSLLLANLFLHYAFLRKYYPSIQFIRYADDIVVHCGSRTVL